MSHTPSAASLLPVDRLASLPLELFEDILGLVRDPAGPQTKLELVSKTFLQFTRRSIYPDITITNIGQLVKFFEYLIEFPEIGSFVESLEIKLKGYPLSTAPLTDVKLKKVLQVLVSLTSLEIKDFARFTRLVLEPPIDIDPLPSLRELSIDEPCCRDFTNPFDPKYWTNLHRYPELFCLRLVSHGTIPQMSTASPLYHRRFIPKDAEIQELTVSASIGLHSAFPDFLAHFTSLSSLRLVHTHPSPTYDSLCHAPRPLRLRSLALDLRSLSTTELAETFLHFSNIRELSFVAGTCSSQILSLLPTLLKLQTVSFEYPTKLSTSSLQAFLETSSKSTTSFTIYLDNVGRKRYLLPQVDSHYEPLYGYRDVGWDDNYTKEGIRKCVEVARSGIRLKGKAVRKAFEEMK